MPILHNKAAMGMLCCPLCMAVNASSLLLLMLFACTDMNRLETRQRIYIMLPGLQHPNTVSRLYQDAGSDKMTMLKICMIAGYASAAFSQAAHPA